MSVRNIDPSHLYGARYVTENGAERFSRVRASTIGTARSAAKSMEQSGEELFAIWLIG